MTSLPGMDRWVADLEARHLRDLTPAEVARALRALSSTYVERRARLSTRGAFDSTGKRAAYALYYGPRRLLLLRAILAEIDGGSSVHTVQDLGCGTGAAAAAWATASVPGAYVLACDHHPWAVAETRHTLAAFGLSGDVRRASLDRLPEMPPRARASVPEAGHALVLSHVVNELDVTTRDRLLPWLLACAARGARVLVVEPLARGASPWWPTWTHAFRAKGGRGDEWKRSIPLPPSTAAIGRAAGLDTSVVSARTLWL